MFDFPPLSIRNILLITISALTLLVMLLAGQEALLQWRQETKIQYLKEATLVGDSLFDAGEKLSVERQVSFSILHAPDRDTVSDLRPSLRDSRRQSDLALTMTIQMLEKYPFPGLQPRVRDIEKKYQALKALRARVDTAIARPAKERDSRISDDWFDESTDMILQTQNLWMEFIKNFSTIDSIVTLQLRFKYFLWLAMEYTGREYAVIGRLIVENAEPTPKEQAQLITWQATHDLLWNNILLLADQSGLGAGLVPYLKDADSDHFNVYTMVKDIFYVPGARQRTPYPINGNFWLELTTQANSSLYALKDASLKETRNYIEELEAKAEQSIIFHTLVLLFTFMLCGYSFQVVILRVLRPINTMIGALVDATQGRAVSPGLLVVKQQDEVGKLSQVLKVYQENALKIIETSKNLEEQRNYLKTVMATVMDAIITIDMYGVIQMANPATGKIFGYRTEEIVGNKINMLMPKRYADEHDSYLRHYFDTGEEKIIGKGRELIAKRKDGSTFPIELAVTKMINGGQIFFVGMIRDITLRKKTDEEREKYLHALENSNRELDDFAYIASHDLKEPLRGLTTQATFLLEDYQEKLDVEAIRRLRRLTYLSRRMEQLISDLLYFSRLGRTELAVQETDPNEIVGEARQLMDTFLKERHAEIIVPQPMPRIVCDKIKIAEVFRNLITNAVKYNDKPERIVEVGCLESARAPHGDEKNVFYIRDNGVGIEPEFHEAIFRIFKRLKNPAVKDEEGTGSGLTFVKKIIERHKGHVWLESEMGKGSTFYFTVQEGENKKT